MTSASPPPSPSDRAALVTFVTAGDGDTAAILDALVAGGADVIELGMPFTDPMADGPAIQAANLRSLAAGTSTADVLAIAAAFRARHPGRAAGADGLCQSDDPPRRPTGSPPRPREAGVDGVICVDIPPEEDRRARPRAARSGHRPRSASPPRPPTPRACPRCSKAPAGFLYYVSVAGITGLQQAAQASIEDAVARLKAATDLPVAVGFGVRTPEQAAAIARVADGVVVGSAIVELVARARRRCARARPRLYPVPVGGDPRRTQRNAA